MKRILKVMELWRLYQFVRFAKKQLKSGNGYYASLLKDYGEKKPKLSNQQVADLWEASIEEEYLESTGTGFTLKHKGRQLTEMYGYGFLAMAARTYGGPITWIAAVVTLINVVIIFLRK